MGLQIKHSDTIFIDYMEMKLICFDDQQLSGENVCDLSRIFLGDQWNVFDNTTKINTKQKTIKMLQKTKKKTLSQEWLINLFQ